MDVQQFRLLIGPVMEVIAAGAVDEALADQLNRRFPSSGKTFKNIKSACRKAIDAGWMCAQGSDGRWYGRIIEPAPETHDLSVDVVQLRDIVAPHHRHPSGEICLTMPLTKGARFDGQGAGWCVNEPGSAHSPTVTGGEVLVLYMLPGGRIEFTK